MAEKYLLRDDETGRYWKATLKQSTIDAIVNPIVEGLHDIDDKLTVANNILQANNELLGQIVDNTTPVVVGVELTGMEGLPPFEVRAYPEEDVSGIIYMGDISHRGWTGNLIYSNGKRVPLSASDFSKEKFTASPDNILIFDDDGDVSWSCEAKASYIDSIVYEYQPGLTFKFRLSPDAISTDTVSQTAIDFAHINVGDTIDLTADDLTTEYRGSQMLLPTKSGLCVGNDYTVTWESSDEGVLTPLEGQEGKFYATKAGTSTISYDMEITGNHVTGTFNAVVLSNTP